MDQEKLSKLKMLSEDARLPEEHRNRAKSLYETASQPKQSEQPSGAKRVLDALTKFRDANKSKVAQNEAVITKQEQQMSPKKDGDGYLKSLWLR